MTAKADLKKVIAKLQKAFKRPLNRKELTEIGELAALAIKTRTRTGLGVRVTGGNRKPLKKLEDQYIQFRMKNLAKLSGDTSASKSNLTFTGQLLNNIKVIKATPGTRGKAEIIVRPSGLRDGTDKPRRNATLAGYVSKLRPFMNLGKRELRELTEEVEKRIRDRIRKR